MQDFVDAAVARAVGECVLNRRLVSSGLHRVYRCRLSDNRYAAVKLLEQRPDLPGWRGRFIAACRLERWVRANTPIRCPVSLVPGDDPIVTVDGETERTWALVYEWSEGDRMTASTLSLRRWRQIVKAACLIASAPPELVNNRGVAHDPPATLGDVRAALPKRKSCDAWRRRLDYLSSLDLFSDLAEEPRAPSTAATHGDMGIKNFRFSGIDYAVIDWENAAPGTLEEDLGRILSEARALPPVLAPRILRICFEEIAASRVAVDWTRFARWPAHWLHGHLMYMRFCGSRVSGSSRWKQQFEHDLISLESFSRYWPAAVAVADAWTSSADWRQGDQTSRPSWQ